MKVGINAVGLYPGKVGGVEQYLRNIISEISGYEDMHVFLFLNRSAMEAISSNDRLVKICIDVNYNHDVQLKGYIDYYKIDVWFCPFFHLIPVQCGIPNITTILDLQQEYYPQNFDKEVLQNRKLLTQSTVGNTDLILTISEFSKQTIVDKYGVDAEKVIVTYLDADASFDGIFDEYALFKMKKKLPKEYVLFPANMWPHKNHISLLKGFIKAKRNHPELANLKLVFTGSIERETNEINSFITENNLRKDVLYLGYIPQAEMKYVFSCASMLAFPSKFEGFGIPLVEAMASGIPIICSRSSCLPEIAGDAALYFDEDSSDEISDLIFRVHTDNSIRNQLISAGKKRRVYFSWKGCAKKTIQAIRSLYKMPVKKENKLDSLPLVSIITPSYNQGDFIRETIESVLNQTYENIEYIVMDGGSTDNTVEILKEYEDRIKWVSEKDDGQADAVNKGIKIAQGEIIGWLNSDDTYYPDAVATAVNEMMSHPDVDMIYGEGNYIDKNSNVTGRYNTKMYGYDMLADECFICQPTAFFTKSIVEKVGGLRADLQLCMDYELWMRIGRAGKILYVPKTLATSRMYEDNKTLSRRWEVYEECCRELKKNFGFVSHNWLVGYSNFIVEMHPLLSRRLCYLWLFLKYNYNVPGYFRHCLKKYIGRWKRRRKQFSMPVESLELFSDGWMSKEWHFSKNKQYEFNKLVIKGENIFSFPNDLYLEIRAGGKKEVYPVKEHGTFTIEFDLPVQDDDLYNICITANQIIIPSQVSNSKDSRSLSVKVSEVYLAERETENMPLVSVITPSYNQGEFLREAIESVLGQDYSNIEYIVVDGGSTDNSLDILKEYSERITYISEPDNGQSDAINKGFRMAKGDIVAWLNSDDIYEPGCISAAVEVFKTNKSVSLVYGDGYIINRDGSKNRIFEYTSSFDMWSLVHIWDYIMQPTAFFRKDALEGVGMLDEQLNWAMDWDLWIKLAHKGEVVYLPRLMACSREYGETKTSTGDELRLKEILGLMQKHSGEKMPYGYNIYHYANLLDHGDLSDVEKHDTAIKLDSLLHMMPVPDENGMCTYDVNFMLTPYQKYHHLCVHVLNNESVEAVIYWNGAVMQKLMLKNGVHEIALPRRSKDKCDCLRIEIESDELKHIKSRSESWIKMELIF